MEPPLTPEEEAQWRAMATREAPGGMWSDADVRRLLATLDAARVAPSDGLREAAQRVVDAYEDDYLTRPDVDALRAALATTRQPEPWTEALADPSFVAALDEGMADVAAGRVSPFQPEDTRTADPGGLLSAQVSAILFGAVDDETFDRVMGAIRRTEAFADLDLYRALQPSWHAALLTYDPPDPIPAGGWSRLMPHTDEAIRIFAALRAALATTGQPDEATVVAMENEGVVTWGDDGHRARFLRATVEGT
jgi:hypothetical protein